MGDKHYNKVDTKLDGETTFYISGIIIIKCNDYAHLVKMPKALEEVQVEIPFNKIVRVRKDSDGTHTFQLDRDFAASKGWLR